MKKNLMKTFLCLTYCFVFLSSNVLAKEVLSSNEFTYTGEEIGNFDLMNTLTETRYRDEQIDDTCTRQIPYTENVCGYETRYRQECHTIPGREECRNVSHRECTNVTRYREECHREPGREVCTTGPSREVCSNRPGRRVCENRNGRRVCRNVPGERVCRRVPGERRCRTEPGRRVCRRVPYTDQDCRNVTRRECNWIPSREECNNVSYQEYVCNDVTRYRTETYACTRTIQVPYTVTLKTFKAHVAFSFENNFTDINVQFKTILTEEGELIVEAMDNSETPVLVKVEKTIEEDTSDDLVTKNVYYNVSFLNKQVMLLPVSRPIQMTAFDESLVSFQIGHIESFEDVKMKLVIEKDDNTFVDVYLSEEDVQINLNENGSEILIDLSVIDFQGFWGQFTIKFGVKVILPEGIINIGPDEVKIKKEFNKTIDPPAGIFNKTLKITNLKKLFIRFAWYSDSKIKKKIRKKLLAKLKKSEVETKIDLNTIKYNYKKGTATMELQFDEAIENSLIIDSLLKEKIKAEIL